MSYHLTTGCDFHCIHNHNRRSVHHIGHHRDHRSDQYDDEHNDQENFHNSVNNLDHRRNHYRDNHRDHLSNVNSNQWSVTISIIISDYHRDHHGGMVIVIFPLSSVARMRMWGRSQGRLGSWWWLWSASIKWRYASSILSWTSLKFNWKPFKVIYPVSKPSW